MKKSLTAAFVLWLGVATTTWADDWPTYRRDYSRGGASQETLSVTRLGQQWVHAGEHPRPAWPGPARWDAFGKIPDLRSMRNYDPVHHVVSVGDKVFFGSSVDGSVSCLDAQSGKVRWTYPTQGPIRIAPTWYQDRLYFGSDDGCAYCLEADSGKLVWRHRPTVTQSLVVNDGRLISFWPVRTGIVVSEGTAYYGASLLPWKKSYLCAVDARTGRPEGKGRYVKELEGLTLEGGLLLSARRLIAPQGRVAPLLFDRDDGKSLGSLHGSTGGCFVLVTEDNQVVTGPGRGKGQITAGQITATQPKNKTKIASFQRGNAVVVKDDRVFLLDDHYLTAINRKTLAKLWRVHTPHACELMLTGDAVFVGGRDEAWAFDAEQGKPLWHQPVQGRAHGLAIANGRILISTDEGRVYCFAPSDKPDPKKPGPIEPAVQAKDAPLAPIAKVEHPGLIGRWVFQEPHVKAMTPNTAAQVVDLAGNSTGSILGPPKLDREGDVQALRFDGDYFGVELQADFKKAKLPIKELTAEAWVRVDKPLDFGGIVCAMQDNGPYERGWILGYNKDKFSVGIAAEDGANVMTYLQADKPFQMGRWHHVLGTYDGKEIRLYVDARLAATSTKQKGKIRYPEKAVYHVGAYRDDDELNPLTGYIHEVRVYDQVLSPENVKQHYEARRVLFEAASKKGPELQLAEGPVLRFLGPDKAVVRWKTHEPTPALLEFGEGESLRLLKKDEPRTTHEMTLDGLRKERLYRYRIGAAVGKEVHTTAFMECDMHANYEPRVLPPGNNPFGIVRAAGDTADGILKAAKPGRGFCLVVGLGTGHLACELARRGAMHVVVVEKDAEKAAKARALFLGAGLLGPRLSVVHVEKLDELPPCFANLVVCETADGNDLALAADALFRSVRPEGGSLMLGQSIGAPNKADRAQLVKWTSKLKAVGTWSEDHGAWLLLTRGTLEGAGTWTHQYGMPDNSGYSGEELGGASKTDDLDVVWFGQPGPRFNVDRNPRKPSPLAVDGRLFVQGMQRVAALDAFNGAFLWTLELPRFRRYNVPHDSSNWCCDRQHLFLAIDDQCWTLSVADGGVQKVHRLGEILTREQATDADWGYLARVDDLLLGTTVKRSSHFVNFWGAEHWYDAKAGQRYVCSSHLFAAHAGKGDLRWSWTSGTIINPTITVADGRVFFVESRNPALAKQPAGQYGAELWKDLWLVALDLTSGKPTWSRPLTTLSGSAAYYLAHAEGKLVLSASDKGRFGVYVFAAGDGAPVWTKELPWEADHHGKHLSRPALVGGQLILRPYVLELASGKQKSKGFPAGHGCGSYCATKNLLVFRGGEVVLWDLEHNTNTRWSRLRPDCWISTIPANGMLLSPEGGGGCSCGQWLEMSVGFMPRNAK